MKIQMLRGQKAFGLTLQLYFMWEKVFCVSRQQLQLYFEVLAAHVQQIDGVIIWCFEDVGDVSQFPLCANALFCFTV